MAAVKETAPGRLEIREGGGCLTLFGLPFLATGIFMLLAGVGVVTMRSDEEIQYLHAIVRRALAGTSG